MMCYVKNYMKKGIKTLIACLCLANITYAETNHEHDQPLVSSPELRLHDVVEKTYQRNPQLQVMQARMKHIDAQLKSTQSFWVDDPSLRVSHYNDELMNSDGLLEWEVGMDLPLWLPGQKQARQKTVEHKRFLIDASEPALKLELAGIVREILWNIALTKNQLAIAEKEWDVVKKLEQDVQKRVELGDLALSDVILAQQESLSKEAALKMAQQEYGHAQHRYDMITGINILPENFEETIPDDLSITYEHPTLAEAREKVTSSTLQRDQIKLEKRGNPSLFVGTRHERGTSHEEFANAIGLNFSMPLGLSSHTTQKITAAEVDLSQNQSDMELLFRELNIAIEDASRELKATQEQFEFAKRQNELSKKNLELARKAFSLGETSLIELIRIQTQAFAVERNMHQKQLEVGLHKARLNQAKGIIP